MVETPTVKVELQQEKELDCKEIDIYRHTFIRYMGYSNEVGEAFRPLIPKSIVAASYGMAIGYVCTDTFDKSLRKEMSGASNREVALVASDCVHLADAGIGYNTRSGYKSVNQKSDKLKAKDITAASRALLQKSPPSVLKTLPTLIGLASIPLIVHPIDTLVDRLMDVSFRKLVR